MGSRLSMAHCPAAGEAAKKPCCAPDSVAARCNREMVMKADRLNLPIKMAASRVHESKICHR